MSLYDDPDPPPEMEPAGPVPMNFPRRSEWIVALGEAIGLQFVPAKCSKCGGEVLVSSAKLGDVLKGRIRPVCSICSNPHR